MINIICFGDSITQGAEFPVASRWTTLLQDKLSAAKPGVFEVHNCGISGNTTAQALDRFAIDVLSLLPGVLMVEFGLNDANVYAHNHVPRVSLSEFERNLREFHRLALANNSITIFIANHRIGPVNDGQGNGLSFNDNFAPYNLKIKELAAELGAHLIDLPEKMIEQGINLDAFVTGDQIHLSIEANEHYAEMVYSGLKEMSLN